MSVIINPELKAKIEARIKEFISTKKSSHYTMELGKIVADLNVLPLYFEASGVYGIQLNGEIVSISWDNHSHIRIEDNPRVCNMVLFQGSKIYPELSSLIPLKTASARICPYCKGTGIDPVALQLNTDAIVCYCGGLGWLPE